MHNTRNAHVAGLAEPDWPANDQAPGVMADGFRDQAQEDGADSHGASIAEQAAWTIEGEAYALAYLKRLQAGMAQPGDLATLLSFLGGEMLHGACRLIEKALEGRSHA